MTRNPLSDRTIETSEEFERVLAAAVQKAEQADVDVRGAWEFATRGSAHEWEVQIDELLRESVDADDPLC